eukprot:3727737-Ditylum_brightwellii.AAC.1
MLLAGQKDQLWKMYNSNSKCHAAKKAKKDKDSIQVSKKELFGVTDKITEIEYKQKKTYIINSDSNSDTEPTNNRSNKALNKSSIRKK